MITGSIRKLDLSHAEAFTQIALNAYTGLGISDASRRGLTGWVTNSIENWPWQDLYGLFRDNQLLGGMCLFEFDMNLNSVIHKAGGIGTVAVDLLHKKEKVARDMILFALQQYRNRGIPMVTLYPFDVAFYRRMGFGYGAQVRHFRVKPGSFPKGESRAHLEFLRDESNKEEVLACYNRFFATTNGLTARLDKGLNDLFDFNENRIIGFRENGQLQGYMVISFLKHYDFQNDIVIKELVYETPEALQEFCTFLHAQSDQFDRVIIRTQDESFHFLLHDPHANTYTAFDSQYLETAVTGVGLMYRIVDVRQFFEVMSNRNFYNQTCVVRLNIKDDFVVENSEPIVVKFESGLPRVLETFSDHDIDTELTIGIAEFSSLMMGAVDLRALVRMGFAHVRHPHMEGTLQLLFHSATKPMSWQHF